MLYPGRIIKAGETDVEIVKTLKARLNEVLGAGDDPALRLDPSEPHFGPRTEQSVKLFQTRHVDDEGRPLVPDGEVGSLTWSALFGGQTVPRREEASDPFL